MSNRAMKRGFTLVEMVVVMTITGIVAAALLTWVNDVRTETRHTAHPLVWGGNASTVFAQLRRDARKSPAVISETVLTLGESRWTRNDGQLRRNGEVLARDVKAVRWQQAGALLTVEIDFEAQNGTYTARRTHRGKIALLTDSAGAP